MKYVFERLKCALRMYDYPDVAWKTTL